MMKEIKPKSIAAEAKDAFIRQAEHLKTLQPGTEEYKKELSAMNELGELAINAAKNDCELRKQQDEVNRAWSELEHKQAADAQQIIEKRRDNWIRYALEAVGIGAPLVFYGIWMHKGFKFEENGTYTSTTFRGLFNRFRPTK